MPYKKFRKTGSINIHNKFHLQNIELSKRLLKTYKYLEVNN